MVNPLRSSLLRRHRYTAFYTALLIVVFTCFTLLYRTHFGSNSVELADDVLNDDAAEALFEHAADRLDAGQQRLFAFQKEGQVSQKEKRILSRREERLFAFKKQGQERRISPRLEEWSFGRKGSRLIKASTGGKRSELVSKAASGGFASEEVAVKRKFVRQMMKHAWDGYAQYAWGASRVSPNSKHPASLGIFGDNTKLGITIVDSLDTLWIMGLHDEFERARQWTVQNLDFASVDSHISVFETTIRALGGLLSAFVLTDDVALLLKAYELGRLLLPAFDTPTGIPWSLYNFKSKNGKNLHWVPGGGAILSEFGTLHLEFAFLSNVTDDPVFRDKVLHVRERLDRLQKPKNLYNNYVNLNSGQFESQWSTSVGALGDSFYEYLLKVWLWSDRTDSTSKRMFDEAIAGIDLELVRTSADGHVYFVKMQSQNNAVDEMEHLACFMGGLYALAAAYASSANETQHLDTRGAQIAETCRASYNMTSTGLGPENFRFNTGRPGIQAHDTRFLLRPEVVETYFVLWRRTRDPKYRQWGWEVAQAIEKYCRADAGYAGLRNVNVVADNPSQNQDDSTDSYFMAETLKYLYLLFVDEKPNGSSTAADDGGVDISLEEFVFNTEAHPLPIYGGQYFPYVRRRQFPFVPGAAV